MWRASFWTRSIPVQMAWVCVLTALGIPGSGLASAQSTPRVLELRGTVVLLSQGRKTAVRVGLSIHQVGSSFEQQTTTNSHGAFHFDKLPATAYELDFYFPGFGELSRTVDVTPSFADQRGRVEKEFSFDEEALSLAHPTETGTVSVRELSVPKSARREFEKAADSLHKGKSSDAMAYLQKAISLAPQYMEAYNQLGVLYFQHSQFAKAEDCFQQALKIAPDAFEPLVNLGGALIALGRADEAIEVNQRAENARPNNPLAVAQLGISYFMAGRDEDALNYLMLTEQLDPANYTGPQLPLARIYLRHSQDESALEELSDYLKYHPDSPEAPSVRAMAERIQEHLKTHPSDN